MRYDKNLIFKFHLDRRAVIVRLRKWFPLFFLFFVLSFIITLFTVFIVLKTRHNLKVNEAKDQSGNTETPERSGAPSHLKQFIYLTETEQCLPHNLAQIGDPDTCNCDVIVLSFRAVCQDERPSHISYLFDPNTTWASGRNVLFFAALDRRPGYHYYIFLNDDTVLSFNKFTPPEMRKLSPFRVVENWLLDYEPAVGVLDYDFHNGAQVLLDRRQTLCGIKKPAMVLPTVFFDAIFNAFHFKAVAYILPYATQFEYRTWYAANKRIVSAVEIKFPGQALLFAPVTAKNPVHRKYPKPENDMLQMWREIIEEIQEETPLQLRNHSLFQQFKTDPKRYTTVESRTFCLSATRHEPIIPYRNFGREI